MSLLNYPTDTPVASQPLRVRLEPYLIETVCELARVVRDKADLAGDLTGLLFGKIEAGLRTVEALKTFPDAGPHSELARRERLDQAFKTSLTEAQHDPELSVLEVVGWFSFRNGAGLLSSDVAFHNQQFRKPEDLALMVWREGPSQITAEIYSKPEHEPLTADDYRWGSLRLSADIRHMREPLELTMRPKTADDGQLSAEADDEPQGTFGNFMRKAEAAGDKIFGLFSRGKEDAPAENVKGYIGDGRKSSQASWPPEAAESVRPQAYFNPYVDTAKTMAQRAAAQASSALSEAPGPAVPEPEPEPAPATLFETPELAPLPAMAPLPPVTKFPAPAKLSAPPAQAPAISQPPPQPTQQPEIRYSRPRAQYALPAPPMLDLGNLGQSPRSRRAPSEVSGLPMVLRQPAPKGSPWPWAALLFVVCSAAVFGALAFTGLQGDGGRVGQVYHSIFPGSELNLRVRTEDDRLRLTWNQRNRAVAASTGGTLQIFDGSQHREIHLEGRQVADGSVLYRAQTNDVTFRLEVRGEQGSASGSVRVLDGLPDQRETLDVSAPKSQGTPTQSGLLSDAQPSAAVVNEPRLLSGSPAARDRFAPTLIRPNTRPPENSAAAGYAPAPANRYETPSNAGSIPAAGGGSAINGWDTAGTRSRYKPRSTTRPLTGSASYRATGYVPPRPLMQVMPRTSSIPSGAVLIRTRVQVQVHVNSAGKVEGAELSGAPVNEAIASAALAAARQWTFQPAIINGARVAGNHTIVFEFRPER